MKKTALILFLVLGLSGTALGYCPVCVSASPACPSCDDPVALTIQTSVPGTCTVPPGNMTVCVNPCTRIITVDVVANCTSTCGCTPLTLTGGDLNLGTLPCGLYMVVVKVYRQSSGGCCNPCGSRPVFCGMAMKSFKVVCDCCGCYPCRCMFCWPCWCCPTNTVD
ncbi:MAG TPA: hypothetical protein PLU87_09800 [Sedimentisphaerales bacterium]|nr:hypothetical protein [Sedimentisphaerales bacterium]HRS11477.1 hypothetical protein [Sedimentisphaerales bacterium]HRV47985.1 hypothetical protein [Sedimentisphaerales bacterium]